MILKMNLNIVLIQLTLSICRLIYIRERRTRVFDAVNLETHHREMREKQRRLFELFYTRNSELFYSSELFKP